MAKKFNTFGVMIDFSRNAVMTVDALKSFLTILRKMGYNTAFLYMEDTYEVEGEPYFGYMRSRYSIEEMKEIDDFAASIGMEAIPCIQTLAHMKTFFKWGKVKVDCDDILLADDDRTYELIENMFKTLSSCFRSKRIHIGMDEAHMIGRGRHMDAHGLESSNVIIKRHLARICDIAEKYDYELLVWSDMFFRGWSGDKVPEEAKAALPASVAPVHWDYYHTDEAHYDRMLTLHKQLSNKTWFAGGVWSWHGHAPMNEFSLVSMLPALRSCRKHGVKDVFMTMWGDDGGECSHFTQLPALFYLAEVARGNEDEEKIKAKFKRMFGLSFEDFMLLDIPNKISPEYPLNYNNPSKYMLYSDLFLGFLDYTVKEGVGELYKKHASDLHATAKKSRKYGYLFQTLATLCDVLSVKYELGVKTRAAYRADDKAELLRLANEDYTLLEKHLRAFYAAAEKQWYLENKPSGFEVQDARLGGLMMRVAACKKRLIAYANGKLTEIPELASELLPYPGEANKGRTMIMNAYARNFTANVVSHQF